MAIVSHRVCCKGRAEWLIQVGGTGRGYHQSDSVVACRYGPLSVTARYGLYGPRLPSVVECTVLAAVTSRYGPLLQSVVEYAGRAAVRTVSHCKIGPLLPSVVECVVLAVQSGWFKLAARAAAAVSCCKLLAVRVVAAVSCRVQCTGSLQS